MKMRLNHVMAEEQLNELGLLKKIGAGVTGAISGYKASQSARAGREHSDRIVANLKRDFMKMVGGGHAPTYDNLIRFLSTHGLQDLDKIPNPADPHGTGTHTGLPPTQPPSTTPNNQQIDPTMGDLPPGEPDTDPKMGTSPDEAEKAKQANLKARLKTGQGMGTKTGTGYKDSRVGVPVQKLVGKNPDGSPKFAVVREFLDTPAGELNNAQIDKIIKDAVKSNYHRIQAAQRGIPYNSYDQQQAEPEAGADTQANAQAEPAATPSPTATNPFSDPDKLLQDWQAYVGGGGKVNPKIRSLAKEILSSGNPKKEKPEVKPAEPETKAEVKPEVKPAPTPDELEADHDRIASGTNETYSRFLGMKL